MTASPKTIDKGEVIAKTTANSKRADALVKAFPMPSKEVGMHSFKVNEETVVNLTVETVPGETPGVTAMKKIMKNKLMPALGLNELVYRSEAISATDACQVLREYGERAAGGDLSDLQSMLAVQAIALDAIFTDFVRRAAMMKTNDDLERMLRIALKAQGQSRTSIESLAVIQQGPKIFAKQANVSNGGNQQVNNHAPSSASASRARTVKEKPAKQTIPKVAP